MDRIARRGAYATMPLPSKTKMAFSKLIVRRAKASAATPPPQRPQTRRLAVRQLGMTKFTFATTTSDAPTTLELRPNRPVSLVPERAAQTPWATQTSSTHRPLDTLLRLSTPWGSLNRSTD